jgi:predicted  nucleic acid-binding Zn-ribbon protein
MQINGPIAYFGNPENLQDSQLATFRGPLSWQHRQRISLSLRRRKRGRGKDDAERIGKGALAGAAIGATASKVRNNVQMNREKRRFSTQAVEIAKKIEELSKPLNPPDLGKQYGEIRDIDAQLARKMRERTSDAGYRDSARDRSRQGAYKATGKGLSSEADIKPEIDEISSEIDSIKRQLDEARLDQGPKLSESHEKDLRFQITELQRERNALNRDLGSRKRGAKGEKYDASKPRSEAVKRQIDREAADLKVRKQDLQNEVGEARQKFKQAETVQRKAISNLNAQQNVSSKKLSASIADIKAKAPKRALQAAAVGAGVGAAAVAIDRFRKRKQRNRRKRK